MKKFMMQKMMPMMSGTIGKMDFSEKEKMMDKMMPHMMINLTMEEKIRTKYVKLTPLIIIIGMVIYSVLKSYNILLEYAEQNGAEYRFSLPNDIMIGIFCIVIVIVFLIQKKSYWVHALSISILASITPFVAFSNFGMYFEIGIFGFDVIVISLLGLHLFLNPDARSPILNLLKESDDGKEKRQERERVAFEKATARYKLKFKEKSVEELQQIVEKNEFVEEAIQAAKELLKEK